jgi:transcriptional regulator with XRE-family HTH domain
MDMKINSALIVSLRKNRGWSQQQLSTVSGVSIRTVQRVENEGKSSVETIKSLAGAFDTDFRTLLHRPDKPQKHKLLAAKYLFAIISLISTLVVTSSTTAATGIEVKADSVAVSSDQTITTFTGGVVITIPDNVSFEIFVNKNSSQAGQLTIKSEHNRFIAKDALITRVEDGLQINAGEVEVSIK